MIEIQKIHFSYDDGPEVLRDVSQGRQRGVCRNLGADGSGKTTLLKIISGILKAQRGAMFLEGRPLDGVSHKNRAKFIAVVPQETSIPFSFSTMEVVLMGRAPYLPPFGFESRNDVAIAKKAMSATDVSNLAERNIQELSGGEKQRVIVARALAQELQLLLLG